MTPSLQKGLDNGILTNQLVSITTIDIEFYSELLIEQC